MQQGTLFAAVPTVVAGLGLLGIGAEFSLAARVRSAGEFDVAVGALVAVYGLLLAWRGVGPFGFLYPAFATYLAVGLFVIRP